MKSIYWASRLENKISIWQHSGDLLVLTFEKNGDVLIEPLRVAAEIHDQLENNLILFFTGTERSASEILRDQDTKSKKDDRGYG